MHDDEVRQALPDLPEQAIQQLVAPIHRFLHVEAASGVVLLACTLAALGLANSTFAEAYLSLWKSPVGIRVGAFELQHSLKHWINDGLMVVFFFVIGLEVKREIVRGELRDPRSAALPVAAALGGMIAPAAVYLLWQPGGPARDGWGIPMATDIAFVVGCLAVLGARVPQSLRVLLLSLAIADDVGAILVIAVGYTASLDWAALALGAACIGAVVAAARFGVRSIAVYTGLGVVTWFFFERSGVHATIAGVILGLLTPAESWVSGGLLRESVARSSEFLAGGGWPSPRQRRDALHRVERVVREASSPLERLEARLHPWVGFAIMPLFALANAGVAFTPRSLADPVAIAVLLGLVVGKPVGVVGASWLATRLRLAQLPADVDGAVLVGAGCLAGIGFTMSLFIAGLALDAATLDAAKVGILAGSALSGTVGLGILGWRLRPPAAAGARREPQASGDRSS